MDRYPRLAEIRVEKEATLMGDRGKGRLGDWETGITSLCEGPIFASQMTGKMRPIARCARDG